MLIVVLIISLATYKTSFFVIYEFIPSKYPSGPISGIVGLVGDSMAFFPSSSKILAENTTKLVFLSH